MDEMEYRDSKTKTKIIPCERDSGALRTVYMVLAKAPDGGTYWLPNGCDELDGSDACKQCCQLMQMSLNIGFVTEQELPELLVRRVLEVAVNRFWMKFESCSGWGGFPPGTF